MPVTPDVLCTTTVATHPMSTLPGCSTTTRAMRFKGDECSHPPVTLFPFSGSCLIMECKQTRSIRPMLCDHFALSSGRSQTKSGFCYDVALSGQQVQCSIDAWMNWLSALCLYSSEHLCRHTDRSVDAQSSQHTDDHLCFRTANPSF